MNLGNVMQQVADRIATIPGVRVKAYPADQVQPPAVVVTYPDRYVYDATYGRGMDRIEALPVVVLIGKVSDRTSRDKLSQYVDGSGAASIKQVLESAPPGTYTAFDTIRVTEVTFDIVAIAAVEYLAATLIVDIAGRGAA